MRDKAGPSRPTPTMLALCPCWSLPEAGCMRHLGGWDHWFLGALAMPESLPSSLAIFGSRAKGNLMLSRLRQQRNCSGKWLAQGQWVEARGGRFRLDQPLPKSSPNGAGHMAGEWQCHSGVRREKHGSQSLELSWRETFLAGTERREYRSRAAGGGGWLRMERATLWHLSAGPGAQLCPPPSTPRRTLLTFAQAQGPCPPTEQAAP